jgi:hypothetical protein
MTCRHRFFISVSFVGNKGKLNRDYCDEYNFKEYVELKDNKK